jgi:uncharacterized protein with GYD domain
MILPSQNMVPCQTCLQQKMRNVPQKRWSDGKMSFASVVSNKFKQHQSNKIMARYISLLRFTEQGARNIKESSARALAFKRDAEKLGVTVETQLWTVGRRDGVVVLSGEEKSILRCLTQLAALGNVRTESLQAFTAEELKAITG